VRFFADHCVPSAVARALEAAGHQVILLRERIPKDSPDTTVIEVAQRLYSVLVSLNGDFSDIVAYPSARFGGIISLQVRNRPEILDAIINNLLSYVNGHPEQESYHGLLILVEAHRTRVRS
jgi:predicted nuclease of predicted toxin-antitoxin system